MGRPREITDQQILEGARASFLEAGPHLSAAAVARSLGISEGTLFNRFPTKEHLLRQALGVPEPEWLELLADHAPDLRAQLIDIARGILTFFHATVPALALLRAAGLQPRPGTGARCCPPQNHHQALSAWIEHEQKTGRLRARSPSICAQSLLGSLHARATMNYFWGTTTTVNLDDDAYTVELIDTLFHEVSLGPKEPNP